MDIPSTVKLPFYEQSVCKWGGAVPQPAPLFLNFEPYEPASKHGAQSMDILASSLSMSILFASAVGTPLIFCHAGLFSRAACYALPSVAIRNREWDQYRRP